MLLAADTWQCRNVAWILATPYHTVPGHTTPYHGSVEWHSRQCTIEYWLGPLGRANCPGARLSPAPLCCLITLHSIVPTTTWWTIRRDPHKQSYSADLTARWGPGAFAGTGLAPSRHHLLICSCQYKVYSTHTSCQGSGVDSNWQKLPPSIHCSSSKPFHTFPETLLYVAHQSTSIRSEVGAPRHSSEEKKVHLLQISNGFLRCLTLWPRTSAANGQKHKHYLLACLVKMNQMMETTGLSPQCQIIHCLSSLLPTKLKIEKSEKWFIWYIGMADREAREF